jgi:hypothetical protein
VATVLGYGFIKPTAGDRSGVDWMPNEASNVQMTNDHNHDGSNSALINISALAKTSQNLLAAAWAAIGNLYRQEVTMPAGFTYDNAIMDFQITNGTYTDCKWNARTEKSGASSYYIYTSDNTITVTVRYI